jgi:hypothetical protein
MFVQTAAPKIMIRLRSCSAAESRIMLIIQINSGKAPKVNKWLRLPWLTRQPAELRMQNHHRRSKLRRLLSQPQRRQQMVEVTKGALRQVMKRALQPNNNLEQNIVSIKR